MKRKNALLCGAPLGFAQDQLWAGLARSLVWGSASLGSRPDSRSESDSYLGLLGLKLSSARLSSCLGWLGTRLDLAQDSDRAQFGSVWVGTQSFARLDSKLGCIGSKPCSAWLEARLDSAQASDRLRLDSRLGTWLGTLFGSRPDLGSGTGSALLAEPAWLEALLTSVLDSA